MDIENGGSV